MNTALFQSFAARTPPVTRVFVYGTLRRGDDNDITRLLPAPRLVGHAHVAGTLHHLGAYPGIVLGGPGRVLGEVVRQLGWLDDAERVAPLRAKVAGADTESLIAFMVDEMRKSLEIRREGDTRLVSITYEADDRMLAARNFQSGLFTMRQIEFSLFDMLLHQQAAQALAAGEANPVQRILDAVRQEVAVLLPPTFNRFQNSFSHIFAGGYAAGYYSYKWAEVLSADCYAAFEEEGLFNPAVGQRFLQEILSAGGSRPAIDSFRAFRGRAPELDALLRHNGMVEA